MLTQQFFPLQFNECYLNILVKILFENEKKISYKIRVVSKTNSKKNEKQKHLKYEIVRYKLIKKINCINYMKEIIEYMIDSL